MASLKNLVALLLLLGAVRVRSSAERSAFVGSAPRTVAGRPLPLSGRCSNGNHRWSRRVHRRGLSLATSASGAQAAQQPVAPGSEEEARLLAEICGIGQGKHFAPDKKRRKHKNKYAQKAQEARKEGGENKEEDLDLDPWDLQIKKSQEFEEERQQAVYGGELGREEERQQLRQVDERRVRGQVCYPDETDIDPYDPSTFGFVEIGKVIGAHGLKGEVKVRSSTDFGMERLCDPGRRHLRSPLRRFPRQVELISGRPMGSVLNVPQEEEFKEDLEEADASPSTGAPDFSRYVDTFIVRLKGVRDRSEASALKEHVLYLRPADLELERQQQEEKAQEEVVPVNVDVSIRPVGIGKDEYMVRELVYLKVRLAPDNEVIGHVAAMVLGDDLADTKGLTGDLLELELPPLEGEYLPRACYIPFERQLVPIVNLEEGYLQIDPPVGLLDLAFVKEEKVVIRGYITGH
mmetsp:Transcript_8331/g.12705  ORF Transcript_8331/g.12705 Transcript_8331/m.12705 type:complete len:462 (-) Transcript_8331:197-1582(-)